MKKLAYILFVVLAFTVLACKGEQPLVPVTHITFTDNISPDFEKADFTCKVTGNFSAEELTIEYATDPSLSGATKKSFLGQNGAFQFSLEGLQIQTTYYYRYTASNKVNTLTDDSVRQFKTKDYEVIFKKIEVRDVGMVSFYLSGGIESAYGLQINKQGFKCQDKGAESVLSWEGQETIRVKDLNPGKDYEVWYYADTNNGVFESEHVSVTTRFQMPIMLPGVFSVSDTKKVSFSRSNLYQKANSSTYSFNDTQIKFMGYFYDPIPSSQILENVQWIVLTNEEWQYLVSQRTWASKYIFYNVSVDEVKGVLLLPDSGVAKLNQFHNDMTMTWAEFLDNQDQGAVFIPYAGREVKTWEEKTDHTSIDVEGQGSFAFLMTEGKAVKFDSTVNYNQELSKTTGSTYTVEYTYAGNVRYVSVVN